MTKLAPGMTVQSHAGFAWQPRHYAFCVRCGWKTGAMSYTHAKAIASQTDSHRCERAS